MRLTTATPATSVFDNTVDYYRLTQWPSDAFLLNSPIRALLTGLLEREPLTVGRLATLSGETATSCREFLMDLDREGVLETLTDTATPSVFPDLLTPVEIARH